MSIKILIADDHGVLRAGLTSLLDNESGMQVMGEARNGDEAVRMAIVKQPDIMLMDISMQGMNGIEATARIVKAAPKVRVIILTVHEETEMMEAAIRSGAMGYIVKSAIKTDLINAIYTVMRGQLYVHPTMAEKLFLKQPDYQNGVSEEPDVLLSPRELEVLRLIAQGYTNSQAAEKLNISPRTIEYHRSNITSKLNLSSRVDLVQYALKNKII